MGNGTAFVFDGPAGRDSIAAIDVNRAGVFDIRCSRVGCVAAAAAAACRDVAVAGIVGGVAVSLIAAFACCKVAGPGFGGRAAARTAEALALEEAVAAGTMGIAALLLAAVFACSEVS